MNKLFLLTAAVLIMRAQCFGAGTSAASFMEIDPSARTAAMAGGFTAIADDSTAIFYNPGGLGFLNQDHVSLSHNQWFEGIKLESLSYARPTGQNITFAAAINYLFSDSVQTTNRYGEYTGESFKKSGGVVIAGAGYKFQEDFSAGANLKMIRESLADESAMAFAADLGALYKRPFGNINCSFGASVQNMGSKIKLYEDAFNIPLKYSLAAAANYRHITFTAGVDKYRDAGPAFPVGAEFDSGSLIAGGMKFAARLGYRVGSEETTGANFTTGIGIGFNNYMLDYAFAPMGDLGTTHRVSFSITFGSFRIRFPKPAKPPKRPEYADDSQITMEVEENYEMKSKPPAKKSVLPQYQPQESELASEEVNLVPAKLKKPSKKPKPTSAN
ncbi:MAG: PorV/PorQ family protein [Elusimicrobia bacterium]|nr:PorV/PorQ family protein [Elusimicrobiota bacterium]